MSLRTGLYGYLLSAATIGGIYGGCHGYVQRKQRDPELHTSAMILGTLRDTMVGSVVYPIALSAAVAWPFHPWVGREACLLGGGESFNDLKILK